LRRLGGLNAAQSSGLFVTFMRPMSTLSSATSVPTPVLKYAPPSRPIAVEKYGGA
jgi:hypothetical protein